MSDYRRQTRLDHAPQFNPNPRAIDDLLIEERVELARKIKAGDRFSKRERRALAGDPWFVQAVVAGYKARCTNKDEYQRQQQWTSLDRTEKYTLLRKLQAKQELTLHEKRVVASNPWILKYRGKPSHHPSQPSQATPSENQTSANVSPAPNKEEN